MGFNSAFKGLNRTGHRTHFRPTNLWLLFYLATLRLSLAVGLFVVLTPPYLLPPTSVLFSIYGHVVHVVYFLCVSPPSSSIYFSSPPYVLHAPPIPSSSLGHSNNIQIAVPIMKLLAMQFSPFSCYFLFLLPSSFLSAILSDTQLVFFPFQVRDRVTQVYTKTSFR
jgi:hypothetical protein